MRNNKIKKSVVDMIKLFFEKTGLRSDHKKMYEEFIKKIKSRYLIIKLAEHKGEFKIDVRSHITKRIFLQGSYEKEELKTIKKYLKKNIDVIDVGANIGLYTIFFANIISAENKVFAIEPTKQAYEYLCDNIVRNRLTEKILLYKGVVTNKPGKYQINFIPGLEEYSSLRKINHPVVKNKKSLNEEVKGQTIDNIVKKYKLKPGFIKLDAEGAEKLILEGAFNTLSIYRPIIFSELSDKLLQVYNTNSQEVIGILEKFKYKVNYLNDENINKKRLGQIMAVPICKKTIKK